MPQSHMTQLRMTRRRVLGAGAALAAAPLVAGSLSHTRRGRRADARTPCNPNTCASSSVPSKSP